VPRLWSNAEIERVSSLFDGDVVNVSAWRDQDKAGRRYRDYFVNARSYSITNFKSELRGFQGYDNEIFLDLEQDLPLDLHGRFDLVFNHTTLEHIYDFRKAFANLCAMSRDALMIVVPWLQKFHGELGDYWRFSPLAMARLFSESGFHVARLTWNRDKGASVYVFVLGVRDPAKWSRHFDFEDDIAREAALFSSRTNDAGRHALGGTLRDLLRGWLGKAGGA
jgi:hypothetical protein